MPELDSIRGLAILMVVLYHGLYWNVDLSALPQAQRTFLTIFWCGRLGVNLFFVLSGFLITGLLLDSCKRTDYYRRFYARRARRILPAYGLILAVLLALHYSSLFIVLSAFYASNLTPLIGVPIAYPVLWSLAVEEHFYFAWPFVVKRASRSALLILCFLIIFVSPILRWVSFHYAHGFEFNDYTWNSADGIACGAAVAVLLRVWRNNRRSLTWLVAACIAIAAILAPFGVTSRQLPIGAALQVVPWHALFTAILGGSLLLGTTKWKMLVQVPALRFLGRISYGLYLVHLLCFHAVDRFFHWHALSGLVIRFFLAATLAVILSWLSRTYFEERFLRPRPRTYPSTQGASTEPGAATNGELLQESSNASGEPG
jgi:peptidoglycan/LPS O-acetylase OafA/YrhL